MKCYLRDNSPEIRSKLLRKRINICKCTEFPHAEWLEYSGFTNMVHGIFPGNDEEEFGSESIFGDKNNFKEKFITKHLDYIDCGKDVDLFIKTIKQ